MKRKVMLAAAVLTLMLASFAALAVRAASGTAAHSGACTSYCARAIMYEDFDGDGNWEPWDLDNDGKVEMCNQEQGPGEMRCDKMPDGFCPETKGYRCQLPSDIGPFTPDSSGVDLTRFWCQLQHGPDTHPASGH